MMVLLAIDRLIAFYRPYQVTSKATMVVLLGRAIKDPIGNY